MNREDLLEKVCENLGWPQPVWKKTRLYSEAVEGFAVQLPGWRYPVVIDTRSTEEETPIHYDNYNGAWGVLDQLNVLKQSYQVELVLETARMSGNYASIRTENVEDGPYAGCVNIILEEY